MSCPLEFPVGTHSSRCIFIDISLTETQLTPIILTTSKSESEGVALPFLESAGEPVLPGLKKYDKFGDLFLKRGYFPAHSRVTVLTR